MYNDCLEINRVLLRPQIEARSESGTKSTPITQSFFLLTNGYSKPQVSWTTGSLTTKYSMSFLKYIKCIYMFSFQVNAVRAEFHQIFQIFLSLQLYCQRNISIFFQIHQHYHAHHEQCLQISHTKKHTTQSHLCTVHPCTVY